MRKREYGRQRIIIIIIKLIYKVCCEEIHTYIPCCCLEGKEASLAPKKMMAKTGISQEGSSEGKRESNIMAHHLYVYRGRRESGDGREIYVCMVGGKGNEW